MSFLKSLELEGQCVRSRKVSRGRSVCSPFYRLVLLPTEKRVRIHLVLQSHYVHRLNHLSHLELLDLAENQVRSRQSDICIRSSREFDKPYRDGA